MHQHIRLFTRVAAASVFTAVACKGNNGTKSSTSIAAGADTATIALLAVELLTADSTNISEPASMAVSPTSIFVADVGTASVLEFSRLGKFVRRIGRKGRGPGEFVAPASLTAVDDSMLVVIDPGLSRVTYISSKTHSVVGQSTLPGLSFSSATAGDILLIGLQDITNKTSAARVPFLRDSWSKFGPIPTSIQNNPQVANSYPFTLVATNNSGYTIGFTGSNMVYRIARNGSLIDSIALKVRRRRGVPDDIAERLAKSTSPQNEAQSSSLLVAMAPMRDGSSAFVHMDFVIEQRSVTGSAYLSTVSSNGKQLCADVTIPLTPDTRPMFAFKGDTLFVVQNRFLAPDVVRTFVQAVAIPGCADNGGVRR